MSLNGNLLERWADKYTEQARPMQATLELTYRCNERCLHCYIDKFEDDPKRVLNFKQWTDVLKQLRQAGTLYLVLMGGEAMLNPYFWEILKTSSQMGFCPTMVTNGQKIFSQKVADQLKDSGMNQITFSLYSLDSFIHDKMTSIKGSHQKTMRAVRFCQQAGLMVGINTLLTRMNIDEISKIEQWCQYERFALRVDPLMTGKFNGDLSITQLRPTTKQLKHYALDKKELLKNSRFGTDEDDPETYVCNVGRGKCAVTAYGELLPCIEVRQPLGLLTDSSFDDLWNSPQAQRWRSIKIKDLKGNCGSVTKSTCEHCPGMAKNELGDPTKILPDFIHLAKIKKDVCDLPND